MSIILNIENDPSCFDDPFIKRLHLARCLDRSDLPQISQLGAMFLYDSFPKPMVRIKNPDHWELTIVLGGTSIKAVLNRTCIDEKCSELKQCIETLFHE